MFYKGRTLTNRKGGYFYDIMFFHFCLHLSINLVWIYVCLIDKQLYSLTYKFTCNPIVTLLYDQVLPPSLKDMMVEKLPV